MEVIVICDFAGSKLLPDDTFLKRYSSQFSVGQAQRVLIAMAILHLPALLIADEPTSALDAITQSEILVLFARLNRELNMGILYISHDLLSVATICHRIAILHNGEIAECATTEEILAARPTPARNASLLRCPSLPSSTPEDGTREIPQRLSFRACNKTSPCASWPPQHHCCEGWALGTGSFAGSPNFIQGEAFTPVRSMRLKEVIAAISLYFPFWKWSSFAGLRGAPARARTPR